MILVGFKRAKIQPLKDDGTVDGDIIVIEGKAGEGATQEARITGLSSDPVKSYGSNVAYYVSQKGTGNVEIDFTVLDMPSEAEDIVLGYVTDPVTKAQLIGENTIPPYCAVLIESEDTQGNVGLFGFFKGKFSKPDVNLKTKEEGNFEPEGEVFKFSAITSSREDASKGNVMIKFIGPSSDAAAVETFVLGTGV